MLKIIMGLKGSGKTGQLIELVNRAASEESGSVVCIEKGARLTYDIPHSVRLIDSTEFDFDGYDFLKGFISGLRSSNYDITHIFFDSVLRIIDKSYDAQAEEFFQWVEDYGSKTGIKFTMMVSAEKTLASENVSKFF
jgi:hypothetical protein